MDNKDLFIKSKLQEDKNIPKEIDELIKNFKGGDIKMENNFNNNGKSKIAKIIAIAACFILVALVGVVLLGQQNGQIIKVGGKDKVEGRKDLNLTDNEENSDREKWEILSTVSILTKNRFEMAEFGGLNVELITPEINYEKNGDVVKVKFSTMPVFDKKIDNAGTVYDVAYTFEYKNNSLSLKDYNFNSVEYKQDEFKEHQEYIQMVKNKMMEYFNTDHYSASELILPEVRYSKQGNEMTAEFLVAPITNKNYIDVEVFKGTMTLVQENGKWVERTYNFHHAFEERWTLNIPQKMLELEIETEETDKTTENSNTNVAQTIKNQDDKIIALNKSNIHSYLGTMSSRFCIENIEKNGDKYTITAYIIDTPRIITKTEMEDLRLGKSITFRNKEWTAATNPNGENVLISGEDRLHLIENTTNGTGRIDNMAGAAVEEGLKDYSTKVKFEVESNILIGSIWNDFKFDNNGNVVAYENDEVVNNFTSITFERLLEMSQKNIGTYEECQAFINNGDVKAIKLFNY